MSAPTRKVNRHMHIRPVVAAVAVSACALGVVACTSPSAESSGQSSSAAQTTGSSEDESGTFTWGETYGGPIRTTIKKPVEFTTSQYAQPEGDVAAWKVPIKFENTTDQTFSPLMLQIGGYTDNEKDQQVHDSANGAGGLMSQGELAPGTSMTVTLGFTGAPGGERKVTVASMDGQTRIEFAGK